MKKSKLAAGKLILKKKQLIVLSETVTGGANNSIQIGGCGGSGYCTQIGMCAPEPPKIPFTVNPPGGWCT